jgi:cysteine synthase A
MPDTGVPGGVGGTAMVELRAVVPDRAGRVLLELEWGNPTGSMKDRMAVAVIEAAESRGDIAPGDTVVEHTAGTTGVSLAFVCAAKGHPFPLREVRAVEGPPGSDVPPHGRRSPRRSRPAAV